LAAIPHLVAAWVSDPSGSWDGPFVASVVVRPRFGRDTERLVRRYYAGSLCVVEKDAPTADELRRIQDEVTSLRDRSPLGTVLGVGTDERHSVVEVGVVLADVAARAFAQERWGGLVRLSGRIHEVRR
jgi:hypothetical protein